MLKNPVFSGFFISLFDRVKLFLIYRKKHASHYSDKFIYACLVFVSIHFLPYMHP